MPGLEMNKYITLSAIQGLDEFHLGSGIFLNIENSSQYSIEFNTREWVKIYLLNGSESQEVTNNVVYMFDNVTVSPEGNAHDVIQIYLEPKLQDADDQYLVRVVVLGLITDSMSGLNETVAAALLI